MDLKVSITEAFMQEHNGHTMTVVYGNQFTTKTVCTQEPRQPALIDYDMADIKSLYCCGEHLHIRR